MARSSSVRMMTTSGLEPHGCGGGHDRSLVLQRSARPASIDSDSLASRRPTIRATSCCGGRGPQSTVEVRVTSVRGVTLRFEPPLVVEPSEPPVGRPSIGRRARCGSSQRHDPLEERSCARSGFVARARCRRPARRRRPAGGTSGRRSGAQALMPPKSASAAHTSVAGTGDGASCGWRARSRQRAAMKSIMTWASSGPRPPAGSGRRPRWWCGAGPGRRAPWPGTARRRPW